MKIVPAHGLTDVPGFLCSAVASNIRGTDPKRLDLSLVYSPQPCSAAAVFTQNQIVAAPVTLSRDTLHSQKKLHGIVTNSGNANACTGPQGEQDALAMQIKAEQACSSPSKSFLVCSTGRIGRALPMPQIQTGIAQAAAQLGSSQAKGRAAAQAILTSDTRAKMVSIHIPVGKKIIHLSGIAKGAGMIQPNMATMLASIVTDAQISSSILQKCLRKANHHSFNAITVDGDASTNDTVIALANGHSGIKVSSADPKLLQKFQAGLDYICHQLADKIVSDGERITKVVEILVQGAKSHPDAEAVARSIGNSLLVKSSWFGHDPNWGRLMDAIGYATAKVIENKIDLAYAPYPHTSAKDISKVLVQGRSLDQNLAQWKKIVRQKRFTIHLNLHLGKGQFRLLATDLSTGYVDFNKSE